MSRRLVAVHQPNLLPWLGFFDKVARADVFVVLDDAQFPKTGGNWTNRVRLLVNGQPWWLTVPVDRSFSGVRTILEIEMVATAWRDAAIQTIGSSYGRAPFYGEVYPAVRALLDHAGTNLASYNMHGILALAEWLHLGDTTFVRSSDLGVYSTSTQRLVDLVRAVDGDAYLVGGGAASYQDDRLFADAEIDVVSQHFRHPEYPQFRSPEFVAGLSVVDALLNCGPSGVRQLLGR